MIELKSYGLYTDQGPHLNINEDLAHADLMNNLFLIMDGFGGAGIGDAATELIKNVMTRSYSKISSDPDSTLPFFFSQKYLIEGNALINALSAAHQSVLKENDKKTINLKGGASVIGCALSEKNCSFVSTGNIKLYLYRNSELTTLLLPDALSGNMAIPVSGIGLFEDLYYQTKEIRLEEGDCIIALTDGIYLSITEEEILKIVKENLGAEVEILTKLSVLSNERGNLDNQSGLIIQF
jgi:serine/threonine protein phosphatase PrpC